MARELEGLHCFNIPIFDAYLVKKNVYNINIELSTLTVADILGLRGGHKVEGEEVKG